MKFGNEGRTIAESRFHLNYGIIIIIFLSFISVSILFNNLGTSTFFDWDESHYGEVALEIIKTNEWIMLKYGGQPDSKPPLGAWLIAISFKIFGINEFALRFWSAIFGTGTILLVYFFGVEIKDKHLGIFSAIFLLTTKGFVGYHGARTGDFDVILTFFITLSLYFFYMSQKRDNGIFFAGSIIAMALAVLTKGIVGLFPAIIILTYLLYFKSIKKTLLTKETGYALISFSVLVLPLFFYRFIKEKDFFIKVYEYHIIRRISMPVEGHVGDWTFYFVALQNVFGKLFFILILVTFIYSLYLFYNKNKSISILVIWISVFMIVFSVAKTKIIWYIIPIYPAISLLFSYTLNILQGYLKIKTSVFILIFLIIMILPFLSTIELTQSIIIEPDLYNIKKIKEELNDIDVLYIHSDEFRQSNFLYLNSYVKEKVNTYNDIFNINTTVGDGVITFNSSRYNSLIKNKDYKLIKSNRFVALFKKI